MSRSRSIHLALHIHKDPEAMAERAAHHLVECCEEAIEQRGVFKLALSGGSTPLPLFRLLSRPDWVERLPWEKIILYWGDERCVSPEDPRSNFGMARRELISNVPVTWYYRIKGEDDPVRAAQEYEDLLKEHFRLTAGEYPVFDLMLLGLGPDGHTASLVCGGPSMENKERIVIDQYIRARNADRVTMTLPVFNNARCCMFMVTGKDKHPVLSRTLNLLDEPEVPAQFIRPRLGNLLWIIDEAAAKGV